MDEVKIYSSKQFWAAIDKSELNDDAMVAELLLGGFKLYAVGPHLTAIRTYYPVRVEGSELDWTYSGHVKIYREVHESFKE